jgi:cobalt-zinc-cadmium efflux system membrane fusion protein
MVQAADPLFVIADLSQVWLAAEIPEQSAGRIRAGKPLTAEIAALPGHVFRGKLSFVAATVNPDTRTVRARMDLPNPGLLLKPAMLARIRLQDAPERRLVVPVTAVVREGNRDVVFVETGPNKFLMQPVTAGGTFGERRVIAEGLREGQRIVVDGGFHLNNERKRASLHSE